MYHLLAASEENGYESSIDNDDDISSDEDPDVVNKLEAEVSSSRILPFHPKGRQTGPGVNEFSLNVFTEFNEFSGQKMLHFKKDDSNLPPHM